MRIEVDIYGNITEHEDAPTVPYVEPNVSSITNSQLRQQLLAMGIYEQVDSAIISGTNTALKIKWEYSQHFLIEDVDLVAIYKSLGLTQTLQELFNKASKL